MKVVCINNIELGKDSYAMLGNKIAPKTRNKKLSLTIGQTYEVDPGVIILGKKNFYMLEKDDDEIETPIYPVHFFVTIEEYRNQKLELLGI